MESIRTAKTLIQEGKWFLKLDPKDAYLTVPICNKHQKFLKFQWKGKQWQFSVLPFGLNCAPLMFTKLLKPVIAILRRVGARLIMYLDDMLLMERAVKEAKQSLATVTALGFIINWKKSIVQPTQEIEFLGFLSRKTMISLPRQKSHTLRKLARRMMATKETSVQDLARILGTMIAAHPAILPAPLYYRRLEREESQALKKGFTYESQVMFTTEMRNELLWWSNKSGHYNGRPLHIKQWNVVIESDASERGWGAFCHGISAGSPWSAPGEGTQHQLPRVADGSRPSIE